MNIDASDLITKKKMHKSLSLVYDEEDFFEADEGIEFAEPVKLDVDLSMLSNIISVDGQFSTVLRLVWSRCLEKFDYPVVVELQEKFSNNRENCNEDINYMDSDYIDITEIVRNNIILALPMKRLCKIDCKGLCQHCGTNLNFSTCSCEKEDIDPRLAKLKDLFSSD